MVGVALLFIFAGSIAVSAAFLAIDWNVLALLCGMFLIGESLQSSGLLSRLEHRLTGRHKHFKRELLVFMLGASVLSAILTNDTIAILGTPVALFLALRHGRKPAGLLLTLAFSVTLGSVASPFGNPQNFIIALSSQLQDPVGSFMSYLALPSIVSVIVAWLLFAFTLQPVPQTGTAPLPYHFDRRNARVALAGFLLVVVCIGLRQIMVASVGHANLPLWLCALGPAGFVVLASSRRTTILKRLDWRTLAFFAAMFIAVQAVWNTGFLQKLLQSGSINVVETGIILTVGLGMSQLLSNVPLVALYTPLLEQAQATEAAFMALAAFSTIAGNLTIMGAASNVIILQLAETVMGKQAGFKAQTMLAYGLPLTLASLGLYLLWWQLL